MWAMKLCGFASNQSSYPLIWQRDEAGSVTGIKCKPVPNVDLTGIDMIVPYDRDRVIVVYGEAAAVEKMRDVISAMDVAPKQIYMSAEIVSLCSDEVKKLDLSRFENGFNGQQANDLKQMLSDAGAERVGSPNIVTVNNSPACIAIAVDSYKLELNVLPGINDDDSITLSIDTSLKVDAEHTQALFTRRRLAVGESTLLHGFIVGAGDSSKELLIFLTPKVME